MESPAGFDWNGWLAWNGISGRLAMEWVAGLDWNTHVIARKTISSFHATIEYKDGYFYLEDLRSTNGTRLNDGKLSHNEPVRLKSGDKIDFSIHEFRFLIPDQTPLGETVTVSGMS